MLRLAVISGMCAAFLIGCGVPALDTTLVSQTPADARIFAIAQRAVRACSRMPDRDNVLRAFRASGFGVTEQSIEGVQGRSSTRAIITAPDSAVSVLYHGSHCYVGLLGMTPDQSRDLAGIWATAFGASPNSAHGDGLSDHVSGAWRRFFNEPADIPNHGAFTHRIYIAAYKTWPQGPYDPQRSVPFPVDGLFPDQPGAAVKLNYNLTCDPLVRGPRSGVILSCDPDTPGLRFEYTTH
jgi:hypothetical protein